MQAYINERTPGIRTEDGAIKLFPALLSALYVAIAAIFIPISLFTDLLALYPYLELLLSVAMPIAGIGVCIIITVSPKPLVPFCVITAVTMFMGASITLSSALCVFLLILAISAYLLREKLWLAVAIAGVISAATVLILTKSLILTALCLVFLPTSVTLFSAFKKKKQRVASVSSTSICMAICFTAIFIAWIYSVEGSLSADTVKNFFDTLRVELIAAVSSALGTVSADLAVDFFSVADATALASSMIAATFNLFPAIFAIILFIVSFIAHSLYISLISVTLADKSELTNAVTFKMSVTSAVLFLVSYLTALILVHENKLMAATVAQNIYTILFPGFTLLTFSFVGGLVKTGKASCLGTLVYVAMFGMLFFFTDVTLVLASFAGAILVIVSAIRVKLNDKDNKQ